MTRPSAPVLDGLLTAQDLADRLHHKNTRRIDEWRVTGDGPKYVRAGEMPYYRPEDVDAWLLSNVYTRTQEEL
ncbi:hypothetical protein [Microbacterium testaceum]|uniref:hypothetical protein n=1 Tax=Microbacterium testaceum TaxID=2033 RepID=UPI0022DF1B88|nr:hypothetical protein [Microbacterium testaceum]